MEGYKTIKNGFSIIVEPWSNKITVKDLNTGHSTIKVFSDHVTAILLAKKL
jgi:hypothetical protein